MAAKNKKTDVPPTNDAALPITDVERQHFRSLLERQAQADAAVQDFYAFLKRQHGVATGWELAQDLSGFVAVGQPAANGAAAQE